MWSADGPGCQSRHRQPAEKRGSLESGTKSTKVDQRPFYSSAQGGLGESEVAIWGVVQIGVDR